MPLRSRDHFSLILYPNSRGESGMLLVSMLELEWGSLEKADGIIFGSGGDAERTGGSERGVEMASLSASYRAHIKPAFLEHRITDPPKVHVQRNSITSHIVPYCSNCHIQKTMHASMIQRAYLYATELSDLLCPLISPTEVPVSMEKTRPDRKHK